MSRPSPGFFGAADKVPGTTSPQSPLLSFVLEARRIPKRLRDDETMCPKPVPTESNRRLAVFSICVMLFPIGFFYGLLARHVTNIPFADDYAILGFLEHLSRLPTILAKLSYIISAQQNEYKPMFANLVFALQYKLFGHPDFVSLSWLGNAFILPLFYLIWRHFLPHEEDLSLRLLLFVPVSFLLFQLQYSETLDWSLPGLQNIPVLVFTFACIAFLSKDSSRSFVLACVFLALSVASSGNGFVLFPIGIAMLLDKKRAARIGIWLILVGLCAALYFHHYNFRSSQQEQNGSVLHSVHYLNPIFALSFMGSAFGNPSHLIKYSSVILGITICFVIVLMAKNRYYRLNPTVFYFASFLVLTAIAVSGIRSKLGFDQSHAGRYKIYSVLLLICCYAFLMEKYAENAPSLRRRYFEGILVFSVVFCAIFDWAGNKHLALRQNDLMIGAKLYEASNHQRGPYVQLGDDTTPLAIRINGLWHNTIQDAESTGLFRFHDSK